MAPIGLNEALDILIVSFLVYHVLKFIRRTHAWALLKGIAIIALIAFVSNFLDLITVNWLLENAMALGLIALVILFQPELRKALEQLGRGSNIVSLAVSSEKKTAFENLEKDAANEIIKCCLSLSSERTGALICIERKVALDDISRTGVKIDAFVSGQLLINIFVDKTPLHDGGVVIRNSRIEAASCIFPLTKEQIGQKLGTRHRAATGLSEISDAVVIVVSEETGGISAAINGVLLSGLTEKKLREILIGGEEIKKIGILKKLRSKKI